MMVAARAEVKIVTTTRAAMTMMNWAVVLGAGLGTVEGWEREGGRGGGREGGRRERSNFEIY